MIAIQKFHLYYLKVYACVKISVECFENFGGGMPQMPPPWLRAWTYRCATHTQSKRLFQIVRSRENHKEGLKVNLWTFN